MSGVVALAGYALLGDGDAVGAGDLLSQMAARICRDYATTARDVPAFHAHILFERRFGVAAVVAPGEGPDTGHALDVDPVSAVAAVGDVWSTGPARRANRLPVATAIRRAVGRRDDGLNDVNGLFSFVRYDDGERTLQLSSDRLGLHPLYYYRDGALVLFSSSVQSMLEYDKIPRRLDDETLGQLLFLGFIPGDGSYLSGVLRLPSGTVVTGSRRGMTARRYWQFEYPDEPRQVRSVDDYASECYSLLRGAAKRMIRAPEDTGVLLSGGLDSRVTLGTMVHEFGPSAVTCTYGLTETTDIRTAREVATALGSRHEVLILKGDTLVDLLNSLVVSDFLLESRNAQGREVMRFTRPRARHWYSGYLLDATFGGYWLADEPGIGDPKWTEACILDRGIQQDRFRGVVGLRFAEAAREASVEAARASLADFPETTPEKAFERFMISFRHRGFHIASHAKYAPGERNFLMCDNDLFDFFLRLPAEMRRDKKVYVHMLKTRWPELAHVRYGNTGAPVGEPASDEYLARKERSRTVRRLARQLGLGRLLGPSPYLSADKAFTFAEHPDMRRFIERVLLSERALSRPHIDPNGVKDLVASLQRSASGLRLLFRLLRAELTIACCLEGDRAILHESGAPWHGDGRAMTKKAVSAVAQV